jgi:hypothetical protein
MCRNPYLAASSPRGHSHIVNKFIFSLFILLLLLWIEKHKPEDFFILLLLLFFITRDEVEGFPKFSFF